MLGPPEPSAVNIHGAELIYTQHQARTRRCTLRTLARARAMKRDAHVDILTAEVYSRRGHGSFLGVWDGDLGAVLSACWQHI